MLVLCATCRRHVKATPCPFCGAERTSAVRPPAGRRLSRAQLFAGAALASTLGAACGEDSPPTPDPVEDGGGLGPQPAYGAPPTDAGPELRDSGDLDTDGAVQPAYGAPEFDGGTLDDAGLLDDGGGTAPAYGSPGTPER